MNKLDDEPVGDELPEDFWLYSDDEKSKVLDAVAENMVANPRQVVTTFLSMHVRYGHWDSYT